MKKQHENGGDASGIHFEITATIVARPIYDEAGRFGSHEQLEAHRLCVVAKGAFDQSGADVGVFTLERIPKGNNQPSELSALHMLSLLQAYLSCHEERLRSEKGGR